MTTTRLLLPFTHGIEMQALEVALRFARNDGAILVPLALLHVSGSAHYPYVRAEALQQAKDFLEAAYNKAIRYGVPVERFEVTASNIVEKIAVFAAGKECAGILLFVRDGKGLLLQTQEIEAMLGREGVPARYLIHLPSKRRQPHVWHPLQQFLSRLNRKPLLPNGTGELREVVTPVAEAKNVEKCVESIRVH